MKINIEIATIGTSAGQGRVGAQQIIYYIINNKINIINNPNGYQCWSGSTPCCMLAWAVPSSTHSSSVGSCLRVKIYK